MEQLTVKNWNQYQHYKDRDPPWIKLHVKLLNDRDFMSLSFASKGLLMLLWILASENEGKIPFDLDAIKFRLHDKSIREKDINLLIEKGFLLGCKQPQADASKRYSETETETETETENRILSETEIPFLTIPLKGKDSAYSITEEKIKEWEGLFPGLDVKQCVRDCKAWNISNPERRKTISGIERHITRWITKANDKGQNRRPINGKQGDGVGHDNLFLQALAEQDKKRGIS